jgi:opacity protein-like surface antigen
MKVIHMFKKIVVVAGVFFSASVFAQAEKFAGVSVGINTGFESNQLASTQTSSSLGAHSSPFNINASYTFLLSPTMTVATGLTYDLTDATSASISSATAKLKNHYALNIEPGYALSENTLGYLKVAYHSASSSLSSGGTTYSKTVTGWGYGFGAKHKLDKNLFINLEVQQVGYDTYQPNSNVSSGTLTHTSTFGTIGLGYQF